MEKTKDEASRGYRGPLCAVLLLAAVVGAGCESKEEIAANLARAQRQLDEELASEAALKRLAAQVEAGREARERRRADEMEAAYRSRDEFDAAVRQNTAVSRASLEKAAVRRYRNNTGGSVMVDTYVLKDGRSINCTTKVSGAGPAIFKCDGDL
ncbi:hypothetical protein [Variovorax arabinosiphilus]|uniref:hypothetical protein n=1 Tax=Variovorax arabinosiphilus TaxID=3053498 RepID=UPI002574F0FF|nr:MULTISPECIES: hypothetical protein [unclassified Variovorax]MDM0118871.1 hypothetical protein [Variovorax sp. J2L1-78]MDM0129296.1 hypothetical protein [Variovorax sp. J2L1-63]MDM0232917.1 hypothetical protein [Variovorax sp. J2R1-6]